jgi:hypothetical protein
MNPENSAISSGGSAHGGKGGRLKRGFLEGCEDSKRKKRDLCAVGEVPICH